MFLSKFVLLFLFSQIMDRSIQFHDELGGRAIKIEDEGSQESLAPKMDP